MKGDTMNKAILLGAALILFGALAIAQDTTTPSAGADTNASSSNTVQGCLGGSAGNWTLTDATGATYQLQGDDSQLSANANKQVEVTGTIGSKATASVSNSDNAGTANSGEAAGTAGSSTATGSNSASTGGSTGSAGGATASASVGKTLMVTSIRKVADSCTSGGSSSTPQQ
jgi:hypothetical protein